MNRLCYWHGTGTILFGSAFIDKQAEEILNLKKELAATRAEIIPLKTENAALKKQNAKLESENAWLKRQIFGSKSERFLPTADQSGLLPGFEETSEPVVSVELQTVAEHTRKVREKNGWDEIPADLPREDRIIDIPAEKRQGMELIGYEDSERLAVRSGLYVIPFGQLPRPVIISTVRVEKQNMMSPFRRKSLPIKRNTRFRWNAK